MSQDAQFDFRVAYVDLFIYATLFISSQQLKTLELHQVYSNGLLSRLIVKIHIIIKKIETHIPFHRFRLVALTNMDRSPSESSLEKIERTDVIEISSHNAIVMQTKENAEVEKEEAIREAVAKVEAEWRSKMETEVAYITAKYDSEKQVSCG